MSYKKLIPFINGENELAANVVTMAEDYCFAGADELFLYNYSKITEEREEFLATLKEIDKKIDIPFIVGMYAARFEDVKKAFLRQADFALLDASASLACTSDYFDKNLAEHLKLNQEYDKSIDSILPINIMLTLHATETDIENIQAYTQNIVNILHSLDFSPLRLSLRLETAKQSYRIDNIDCTKDIVAQELILE